MNQLLKAEFSYFNKTLKTPTRISIKLNLKSADFNHIKIIKNDKLCFGIIGAMLEINQYRKVNFPLHCNIMIGEFVFF